MLHRTRHLVFYALLIVLVGAIGLPQISAQTGAPSSFAEYFPEDSLVYFNIRIDDATIETLDAAWSALSSQEAVAEAMGPGVPPTLTDILDLLTLQMLGGDFQTTVRSWLGDRAAAAVRVPSMSGAEFDAVVAIDITDKIAATTFIENLVATQGEWKETTTDTYNIFSSTQLDVPATIAVAEDVILIGTDSSLLPLEAEIQPNLADNTDFQDTLAMLPADSYSSVLYVNVPAIMEFLGPALAASPDTEMFTEIYGEIGSIAAGTTLLNDRSMVLDIAQHGAGAFALPDLGPMNTDFLAAIPEDATFALLGTDIAGSYRVGLENLRRVGPTQREINDMLTEIDRTLFFATGLHLEEDIIGWMTGDYALFATIDIPPVGTPYLITSSLYPDEEIDLGIEFGVVVEATDAAKVEGMMKALVSAMEQNVDDPNVTIGRERIAGVDATVMTIRDPELPSPLELVIGANDRVLVIATRGSAVTALEGTGGLDTSPRFVQAQQHFLPDTYGMMYIDRSLFTAFADLMVGTGPAVGDVFSEIIGELGGEAPPEPDLDQMRQQAEAAQETAREFAALFDSLTVSYSTSGDGLISRIVLNLTK